MAATSISKNIAAPKKRARSLIITRVSFVNAKTLLGAGAFYILFIALVIGFLYPSLSQLNFNAYLTSNAVSGLIGAKLTNVSFSSILAVELYSSLYALIWGGIIAFMAGAALPATFENGTLDLALARPISRTRYYLEMWLSAVLGAIFLSLAAAFSVWLATLFVKNPGIDWGWLAIAELVELALMFLASGIGMLFGSFMNGSRAAGGAALGIIALAYLMNTLGSLSDKLTWMLKIQPLYYVQGIQALAEHSITGWYPLVPVIGGLICGIAGLIIFNRRDLPTT
ncbi:MAG TPA: ABC transporter permease subunit [Ktedonobacteraceae bacterium]|nr:ABC transporter permease subunit [Ktedonobacteraceae bacterium]